MVAAGLVSGNIPTMSIFIKKNDPIFEILGFQTKFELSSLSYTPHSSDQENPECRKYDDYFDIKFTFNDLEGQNNTAFITLSLFQSI